MSFNPQNVKHFGFAPHKMNKEFWINLTVFLLIFSIGVCVVATVIKISPASVACDSAGCGKRITYSLPKGYDLNFKNPYNVIDTEDGLDVIFHFNKKD